MAIALPQPYDARYMAEGDFWLVFLASEPWNEVKIVWPTPHIGSSSDPADNTAQRQ